jgi:hypothetical protein
MKVRLEGLKFIASSVIYFKKIVFKSLLTLKMDNNFADLNDTEHPSYSKFIEQNTDSNRSTQFYLNNSFSPLKFENNTYSNIKETENKIRIVKHYDFAKTKEASVVRDINNLKVYSIFPKEWLDNFTSLSVVNKKIHFQKQLPTELYFTKLQETEFSLSVGQLDDFSFVGDFYLHLSETENTLIDNNLSETNSLYSLPSLLNSAIYPNKEVVNLSTLFSESITFTNGKTNALVFNNFCTGSQPFSFEIKQVTKTQLLNSNNMFVPIAFKTTRIVYDNLETTLPLEEDIYYLSFVNFNNIENTFRKFTKCQKFLQYFDRLLCTENSQAISNPQIYEEELAQRFGKILKYSKLQKDKFERIGCDFINRFTNQNPKVNSLINPSRLSFLNGKLNIDEKVLNKLQKSKETKDKINEKLTIELNNLYKLINEEEENKSKIKDLQQEIQSFTNLIKEKTLEIETINRDSQTLPVEIEKQKTKYEKQEKLNQTFMLSFNEVVKEYEEQEKQALENNNFIPDSFFDGLSSKGLFLTELGLQQYDDPVVFYDCQKIQNLTKDTYSKSKIVSLDFVIAKPFAIKVDGDSENLIYAGPLKVRVTNESIQVAALNTSSIFAFISENTAALHPHACSFGIYKDMNLNDLWLYKRGCLGEASPYLYNSFKENSLKMIIVNCLVWLTSANSSDAWGKNYKFFPKKNDINLNNLESPAIDVDSLIDFIKDSEEENSSDFQNQEQTLYFGNPEEEIDPTYCEHDHDERGHCIYCGDYDADFDESYAQEDENNEYENEEAVLPENIVQQTYTPFFTLTNTNNNER